MNDLTEDIKAIVLQSIKQAKEKSLPEARISIPNGYEDKFFNQRDAIKKFLVEEAYDYKEFDLRGDIYNGWDLTHVREGFGQVPDDMISVGKIRHFSKRGSATAKNYRIWVVL